MGNGHAGVALPTSQMLLFAQSWAHVVVPTPLQFLYFCLLQASRSKGSFILSSSHLYHSYLASSQCLSQGEEIRMLFLPFLSAHSYLSKDQPFPNRGSQPSLLPQ